MKEKNTHANRGRSLERAVRMLFRSYESRNIPCQQIHPATAHDGTIVAKAPYDFEVYYQGKLYAFDTKECALPAWPIDKVKMHQLKAMLNVIGQGGEGFFLVHFTTLKKLIKYGGLSVQQKMSEGAKKLTPEDGTPTTINIIGVK